MRIKTRPFLFILSIGVMCGYKFIEIPYMIKYIICFAWFAYSLTFHKNYAKKRDGTLLKLMFSSYLVMLFISPLLFLINTPEGISFTSYISRLISTFLQSIGYLGLAYAAIKIFGIKAITYSFYGLVTNNIIGIAWGIYRYGFSAFISFVANPFSSQWNIWVREGNISNALELHEVTFSLGFYLIYYLLFTERKKNKRNIIACVILIVLGFKRIQMAAIVAVIIVTILIRKKKKTADYRIVNNIILAGTITISMMYIYILSTNYIALLAEQYGINFMARLPWFDRMRQYYSFSPFYIGSGWGATSRIVEALDQSMHNDILRCYIDFGFVGFLLWELYNIKIIPLLLMRKNLEAAKIYICFIVYAFVTYATDNTLNYPIFQFSMIIIVLCTQNHMAFDVLNISGIKE